MGPNAEEKLQELMGKEMKSVQLNFKKNPRTYSEVDLDRAIDQSTQENYKFNFGLSLERGSEPKNTEEGISDILSSFGLGTDSPNQPVTNAVRQLDIPRMMSTFEIVAEEGEETVHENLADTISRENIDTTAYGYFDTNLGQKLCESIDEEFEEDTD